MYLDLANGLFGSGLGQVKFESSKVRSLKLCSGSNSVRVNFALIEFSLGSS